MDQQTPFHAFVLAGRRGDSDPVAEPLGLPFKALVPVAGRPMLARVVAALSATPDIAGISLVGLPDEMARGVLEAINHEPDSIACVEGRESPSRSVAAALRTVPESRPVLVTTADHALLRPDIVSAFLDRARASSADVVVGLARHDSVLEVCPDSRRTVTRFRDGGFCGCNLFAFMTPAGERAVAFWQRVEDDRKHPVRIARAFGLLTLLRYVTGRLSLDQAMKRVSGISGANVAAAVLPFGEAAVDVDKPEDLAVAESLARRFDSR